MSIKPPNAGVVAESVMMMKSIMNTPAGIKAVVQSSVSYRLIMLAISACGVASDVGIYGTFLLVLFFYFPYLLLIVIDFQTAKQISQAGLDVLTLAGYILLSFFFLKKCLLLIK